MACGCRNKGRQFTEEDPLILGEDFGESRQVRATVHVLGIAAHETAWVRGSKVDFYVEHGWLQAVELAPT